jgi:tetratricopeptide (TPR) repeat protein
MNPSEVQGNSPFLEEADLLLKQGHFDSARRLAEENLARLPFDIEGRIVLCRALLGMDAPEAADPWIREIDRWIRLTAQIYLDAGDSFARKGRLDEAARFYKKFLCLNPEAPEAEEISARISPDNDLDRDVEPGPDSRYEHVEEIDRQFWTVTLADLYTRQGHLDMARGGS